MKTLTFLLSASSVLRRWLAGSFYRATMLFSPGFLRPNSQKSTVILPYLALVVLLLPLSSCSNFFERAVNDVELSYTPQLTLHSLVIPQDSLVYAEVGLLQPPDGNDPMAATFNPAEVSVTLTSNGQTHPFTYAPSARRFELPLANVALSPGTTFTVSASWEDLRAEGSSTLPQLVPQQNQLVGTFNRIDENFEARLGLANPSLRVDGYALLQDNLRWRDGEINSQTRSIIDYLDQPSPQLDTLLFRPTTVNQTFDVTAPSNQFFLCYAPQNFLDFQRSVLAYNTAAENPFSETTNLNNQMDEGLGLVAGLNCLRVRF
ncbi:MAG: hypothetical protein AAF828_07860 [Bacteroidota bacterium]